MSRCACGNKVYGRCEGGQDICEPCFVEHAIVLVRHLSRPFNPPVIAALLKPLEDMLADADQQ